MACAGCPDGWAGLYPFFGDAWIKSLGQLQALEKYAEDAAFRAQWRYIKRATKEDFSGFLRRRTGITVDPASLFDVQVKRIHEYKRQHLNVLHIIALYHRIKSNPTIEILTLAPLLSFICGNLGRLQCIAGCILVRTGFRLF